jgi:hypothetical protein
MANSTLKEWKYLYELTYGKDYSYGMDYGKGDEEIAYLVDTILQRKQGHPKYKVTAPAGTIVDIREDLADYSLDVLVKSTDGTKAARARIREGDDVQLVVNALAIRVKALKSIRTKPTLREWASRWRTKGKFRWLEVQLTDSDGGGYGTVTCILRDHSYPGAKKYKWFECVIHSSMTKEHWRKTVANAIKKMRKQSREDLEKWLDEN